MGCGATFDYASLGARTQALLTRFGQPMTLVRQTGGAYSAGAATQAATNEACNGVLTDYSALERANSQIEMDDRRALIAGPALTAIPTGADQLVIGADTFAVVRASAIAPGGVVLAYDVQVRR